MDEMYCIKCHGRGLDKYDKICDRCGGTGYEPETEVCGPVAEVQSVINVTPQSAEGL